MNYYNDNDAAQWLRNLVATDALPAGTIDPRSIAELEPGDLKGYQSCHFFAGIGGWPYALDLAGWGDRPVWTASLPCQPYSSAGKRKGSADERDLWPVFFSLVEACRPAVIFGEQVASADVIGCIAESDENMQDVLDREAVLGILRELEGSETADLQGLRPGGGAQAQAGQSRIDARPAPEMAPGLSRPRPGQCGEAPGEGAGHPVRPQPPGHPEADRGGTLRTDGDRLQPRRAEGVERAVAGPAKPRRGVYPPECEGGPLRAQRDGECLGREPHPGDCQCDHCAARREIKRLVARDRRRSQGADRLEWLSRIRDDLEGSGYAFGACVVPACSVGAPHIRQRLFWVGVANSRNTAEKRASDSTLGQQWAPLRRRPEQFAGLGTASRDGNGFLAQGAGGMADANGQRQRGSAYAYSQGNHDKPVLKLPGAAQLTQTLGKMPSGSPASTAKPGALNPQFTRWLMGYPTAWANCAPTEMLSSRRSPPSSSAS